MNYKNLLLYLFSEKKYEKLLNLIQNKINLTVEDKIIINYLLSEKNLNLDVKFSYIEIDEKRVKDLDFLKILRNTNLNNRNFSNSLEICKRIYTEFYKKIDLEDKILFYSNCFVLKKFKMLNKYVKNKKIKNLSIGLSQYRDNNLFHKIIKNKSSLKRTSLNISKTILIEYNQNNSNSVLLDDDQTDFSNNKDLFEEEFFNHFKKDINIAIKYFESRNITFKEYFKNVLEHQNLFFLLNLANCTIQLGNKKFLLFLLEKISEIFLRQKSEFLKLVCFYFNLKNYKILGKLRFSGIINRRLDPYKIIYKKIKKKSHWCEDNECDYLNELIKEFK